MSGDAMEFACEYCGWEGTEPVLDAHLFAWCPRCGKPAEFAAIARKRRDSRSA